MKNPLKSMTKQNQSSAHVVDGKLILSFPNAITPVLWQMDLNETKSSALEVQKDDGEKAQGFVLKLKTPRGEALDIATFESRDEAVAGLMAASRALENAHGHIRPAAQASGGTSSKTDVPRQPRQGGGLGKLAGSILAIVFILILFSVWGALAPRSPSGTNGTGLASTTSGTAARESAGVPVSADDFLRGQ